MPLVSKSGLRPRSSNFRIDSRICGLKFQISNLKFQIYSKTRAVGPCGSLRCLHRRKILQSDGAKNPESQRSVDARHPIVRHDSPATRQRLRLAHRKRLPNVEYAKKYKTQQQIFPAKGSVQINQSNRIRCPRSGSVPPPYGDRRAENNRQMLAGNFIDDDLLRILYSPEPRSARRCPNANSSGSQTEETAS